MRQIRAGESKGDYSFTTTEERKSKKCIIAWEKDLSGFCIVLSTKDYNGVDDEIDRLRKVKQNALVESAEREGVKQRIKEMREPLDQQSMKGLIVLK